MSWSVEFDSRVEKDLRKLDHTAQKQIIHYLETKISGHKDPRRLGKALSNELKGLWRYRVRDFRIIAEIKDQRFIVVVVKIAHRSKAYN